MKKLIAISAMALVMTTCSVPASGAMNQASAVAQQQQVKQVKMIAPKVVHPIKRVEIMKGPTYKDEAPAVGSMDWMAQEKQKQEALEDEIARLERIASNTEKLNKVIGLVKKQVGKTWYVFSGSTPEGWDCSGLVMWAYGNLGYELEHRASRQQHSGELVDKPKIGDIVAFTYKGSKTAFHVGIYTGPNEMIHAGGQKGDRTEITSVSGFSKGNGGTEITYTRLLETNH